MKQIIFITTLVLLSITSNAQDIMTMKKGNRVNVIVREITPKLVRYNLYSEPNGKVLFIYKDMVSSILYQNGRIEIFAAADTPESTQTEQPILQNQQRQPESVVSLNTYNHNGNLPAFTDKSSKINQTGTWLLAGGAVFLAGGLSLYALEASHSGKKGYIGDVPLNRVYNTGMIIGGIAIACGITCKIKSGNLKKKSSSAYNQSSGNYDYSLNVGSVGNGIGLSVSF